LAQINAAPTDFGRQTQTQTTPVILAKVNVDSEAKAATATTVAKATTLATTGPTQTQTTPVVPAKVAVEKETKATPATPTAPLAATVTTLAKVAVDSETKATMMQTQTTATVVPAKVAVEKETKASPATTTAPLAAAAAAAVFAVGSVVVGETVTKLTTEPSKPETVLPGKKTDANANNDAKNDGKNDTNNNGSKTMIGQWPTWHAPPWGPPGVGRGTVVNVNSLSANSLPVSLTPEKGTIKLTPIIGRTAPNSSMASNDLGMMVEKAKYIVDLRLGPNESRPLDQNGWVQLPENLNPRGRHSFLFVRLSEDPQDAITDVRIISDYVEAEARSRVAQGYTLIDHNLNMGVTGKPPFTFICYSKKKYAGAPLRSIKILGDLATIQQGFIKVLGDYGGNCNLGSIPNIFITISRSQPLRTP
jgi:hypothetical protein